MKSILVIGMGRFGRHFAKKMLELGNEVMVIDKEDSIIEQYQSIFTDACVCDCTNEEAMKTIGVQHFDVCFVAVGEDFQSSLVITSILKKLGANYIVSKAKQDIQKDLLMTIGANEVVYPERDYAERLAVRFNATNVFDYIQLTQEYSIYEIPILNSWYGKTLSETDVRKKYKINIVAIKNDDGLQPVPDANYVFRPGDHIIIISKESDALKLSSKTK